MPLGERKEAEMKPTPRSERMGIIADALMAARNFADKAQVPESVPLIGGQGLGSLVLGKAPEELNEMSYGNMPMRINPLAGRTASYVPEMKAGRKEQVADLAMLAGVPKVGKAGVGFAGVGDVGSGLEKSGLLVKKADDVVSKFGTEPKKLAKEGQDVFEALNITPEKKEQWRSSRKVEQRSSLLPEIEDAAEKLYNKQISPAEFRALSVEKQPIKPFDKVPDMPSFEDIASALKDSQVKTGIVGVNLKLEAGTKVASRLDIPAYNDYDTWIVSLHDGTKKSGNAIGYAKTAVLKDVEFKSDPKTALDIARRKPLAGGGRMGKATIARIFGEWVPHDPAKAKEYAETVMNNKEWSQVGMNPYRASYFYDKSSGLPVISAEEVIQVGPLVLAKKAKTTVPDDPIFKVKPEDETSPTFAKGGMMKPTIKGFQDGGMNVDPVSGNEVPTGSLPEEVRDDVDAKLSPGEFVIPADVVRFIGLERLMKMRDEAKKGIQRMAEIGQMGNADEVGEESNSTYEDDEFESEIDDILGEVERENEGVEMAGGGFIAKLMGKTIRESAEKAGTKAPVTATKNLTTAQDLRTSITDRINVEKELGRRQMEGFDYKFKEGQRVFTKDSAAKNRPPMTIVGKTRVGNKIVTEDGTLTGKKVIDPVTGKAKRTPYEPGYRVRVKQGEDELEFDIPQSAIVSDVEMAFGGYVASGTDFSKVPDSSFDVRYYKGPNNQRMFITHINGKPMTPIPEGFKEMTPEEAMKIGSAAAEEEDKNKAAASATTQQESSYEGVPGDPGTWEQQAARNEKLNQYLTMASKGLPFVGAAKKVADFIKPYLPTSTSTPTPEGFGTAPLSDGTPGGMMSAVAADAYSQAKDSGLSDVAASRAAAAAAEAYNNGQEPLNAVNTGAVAGVAYQNDLDSLMEANVSRTTSPVGTTASPVESRKTESRPLDLGTESSVGSPESEPREFTTGDWGGLAKGGLVSKRQYPAKKKKGKGIAASK